MERSPFRSGTKAIPLSQSAFRRLPAPLSGEPAAAEGRRYDEWDKITILCAFPWEKLVRSAG